jgi:hypothetical protein
MLRRLAAFLALMVIAPIDAHAAQRGFPSLAKRPAESRETTVQPAPAPGESQAAADPALLETVRLLRAEAQAGDSAFRKELASGRGAVSAATGSDPVSEAWVTAQMAISAADAARYDSVAALASLDTLHIDHQNADDSARVSADIAAIDPARAQVLAMVDAQNDALDRLRASLKLP